MKSLAQAIDDHRAGRLDFDELIRLALAHELKIYGIAFREDDGEFPFEVAAGKDGKLQFAAMESSDADRLPIIDELPVEAWMEKEYKDLAAIEEDVPEFLWAWFNQDRELCVTYFIEDVSGIGNMCQSVVRVSFRNLVKEIHRRARL